MAAWTGRARLAVLIDAENVSARHARTVFEAAAGLGEATVRRIYGDFSNGRLASWNAAIRRFAIVQHQQCAHVQGKNAADIALVIDAMDLLYRERLDSYCLVSSDSDFTRLAQRLREGGFTVHGFGETRHLRPGNAPAIGIDNHDIRMVPAPTDRGQAPVKDLKPRLSDAHQRQDLAYV